VTPSSVVTPSVVNLSQQSAVDELEQVGLKVHLAKSAFSETVKKGDVKSQDPAGGAEIDEGGTVTLVVSKGPERTEIPDVATLSESDAASRLEEAGFTTQVVREYDDDVAKDMVISTDPAAGTPRKPGETVTILVSKGKKPIELPSVVGKTPKDAKVTLEELGLKVEVTNDATATGTPGRVASQEPAAGESVSEGETVTLTVPEGLSMPTVTGMEYQDAKDQLEAMGLRVSRGGAGRGGTVFAQDPQPGSQVRKGDRVTLWVL
jgi:serine/threonine-protein kinase